MSDQKKEYPNSGNIYRKDPPPTDPNHAPYSGHMLVLCPHCQAKTDYWLDARVIDGRKGKFFGVRIKPKHAPKTGPQPETPRSQPENDGQSDIAF